MPTHVNCNLCGQDDTEVVQKAEEPYEVVKCKSCGLVYTNPQPDRGFLEEHYQEDYYKEWVEKQMKKRIPMWKRRLKDLLRYKTGGRLLDVGFGVGTFLNLAKEKGFDVCGTEISKYACQYAKENFGIEVFRGDLTEARFPAGRFDVVTFWHTLEHLPDPQAALKEIHRILNKDGLLVVAVPNLNNFITRILYFLARGKRLKLFSIDAKELHFWHFSARSLARLLKETGFIALDKKLDLAQIELQKKMVDLLTLIVHAVTGKNFGEAMKVYAAKIEDNEMQDRRRRYHFALCP
ncbi:MAG: class I SAM-dependent methyltransferase [Candidatus Aminicenantes bacterium]|nr:class I SAM-dependent methyltransferase [Candidatus Aminicenantes bacterium]MDH5466623.1 class I SAM-dependent methyltransferase [Candidatus Aminicenantes bacterium]MDH5704741.1 class I SAM-dependent methyltransferase [Candidatus Aminicenantes bacterium]